MKENRQAAVPFILVTVFLDMMGIAIVIPVLPGLIATFTADRDTQTYWYGAMLASYGLMQFVSAPFLGALSDRLGRRPVLLVSIFGLAFTFLLTDRRRSRRQLFGGERLCRGCDEAGRSEP